MLKYPSKSSQFSVMQYVFLNTKNTHTHKNVPSYFLCLESHHKVLFFLSRIYFLLDLCTKTHLVCFFNQHILGSVLHYVCYRSLMVETNCSKPVLKQFQPGNILLSQSIRFCIFFNCLVFRLQ